MRAVRRSGVVAMLITVAAACSSGGANGDSNPPPLSCSPVSGSPDCNDAYEYDCTGSGTMAGTLVGLKGGTCDSGSPAPGGSTRYCCTGCKWFTNTGTPPAPTCPSAMVLWQGFACTGSVMPPASLAPPSTCIAEPKGSGGEAEYCCFVGAPDPGLGCVTDPGDVTCTGGAAGFLCDTQATPPHLTGQLDCSPSISVGYQDGYCCTASQADCAPTSMGCLGHGKAYACDGIARPESTDPTLVCNGSGSRVEETSSFDVQIVYCCQTNTSPSCKADSTVPNCANPDLFGFSCSGGATPQTDDPSLVCGPGIPGPNGATQYCCAG